jgi:hypothetical protein
MENIALQMQLKNENLISCLERKFHQGWCYSKGEGIVVPPISKGEGIDDI